MNSKITKILIVFFFPIFLIGACLKSKQETALVTQQADDHAEILLRIQNYYDDFSARDWDKFNDHFWGKAIMATVWNPDGTEENLYTESTLEFIKEAHKGPGSKPIFEEKMTHYEIKQEGNLSSVWAYYDAKFGEEGDIMEWSGVDAFTLLRYRGEWKIVSLGYTALEDTQL